MLISGIGLNTIAKSGKTVKSHYSIGEQVRFLNELEKWKTELKGALNDINECKLGGYITNARKQKILKNLQLLSCQAKRFQSDDSIQKTLGEISEIIKELGLRRHLKSRK